MRSESDGRPIVFCSIATASHVEQACAALRSFGWHAPGSALVLLLATPGREVRVEGIRTFGVHACVPPREYEQMRTRYSAAELCFALKPHLLGALIEEGFEQVHYVDADCRAFAALAPLIEDLAGADVLLTPHVLEPIPDDGLTPSALTVLRAGTFNAGYIGVRATDTGRSFARWLGEMTRRHAYNQPAKGMCGDQRWLDLAPALFPGLRICRRRGANVAYWNLHERPLARRGDGAYSAGGEPLMFFHFSGYEAARPTQLSRHQNRHPLVPGEPLQRLVEAYVGDAVEAVCVGSPASAMRPPRLRALFSRGRRESGRVPRK